VLGDDAQVDQRQAREIRHGAQPDRREQPFWPGADAPFVSVESAASK
jgi:hypothetical protein